MANLITVETNGNVEVTINRGISNGSGGNVGTLQQVTEAGNSTSVEVNFNGGLTGNLTGNVSVDSSLEVGNIENLRVDGGSSGQVITTDGSGNLSFTSVGGVTPNLQEVTDSGNVTNNDITVNGVITAESLNVTDPNGSVQSSVGVFEEITSTGNLLSIKTVDVTTDDTDAGEIDITGGTATGANSEGGDVFLTGGDGTGPSGAGGGEVRINGGLAFNRGSNGSVRGGGVTIEAPPAYEGPNTSTPVEDSSRNIQLTSAGGIEMQAGIYESQVISPNTAMVLQSAGDVSITAGFARPGSSKSMELSTTDSINMFTQSVLIDLENAGQHQFAANGNVVLSGTLFANLTGDVTGNLNGDNITPPSGTANIAGNLQVTNGILAVSDIGTGGNMEVSGNVSANNISVTNGITVDNVNGSGTISGDSLQSNTVIAQQSIETSGNLTANIISVTNDITSNTANIATDIQVGNNVVVTNDVNVTENVTANNITANNYVRVLAIDVGNLPAAVVGARAFVTDSTRDVAANSIGDNVVGGGTFNVPVFSDGTNWRIG